MAVQEVIVRLVVEQAPAGGSISTLLIADDQMRDEFVEVAGKEYSPSQQLRFALLRRYKEKHMGGYVSGNFEAWYDKEMARIIAVVDPKPKV